MFKRLKNKSKQLAHYANAQDQADQAPGEQVRMIPARTEPPTFIRTTVNKGRDGYAEDATRESLERSAKLQAPP